MGDNFGIHRPGEVRTVRNSNGTPTSEETGTTPGQNNLSDFLLQLEEYTPTVSILIILMTKLYMC